MPNVATVECNDESRTPFQKQLGWHPAPDDDSLIEVDRILIKHGYAPSPETIEYLQNLKMERVPTHSPAVPGPAQRSTQGITVECGHRRL